jgi:hypothetical protein
VTLIRVHLRVRVARRALGQLFARWMGDAGRVVRSRHELVLFARIGWSSPVSRKPGQMQVGPAHSPSNDKTEAADANDAGTRMTGRLHGSASGTGGARLSGAAVGRWPIETVCGWQAHVSRMHSLQGRGT